MQNSLRNRWSRLLITLIALTLLAAACSSDSTVDGTSDSAVDGASDDDSGAADVSESDNSESDALEISGPTTTFIPDLEADFSTDGGATSGNANADVIIDANATANLTPTLANLTWPTDWTRRTVEDWDEFLAGLGGNDPRDGIRPIDTPVFETVALAAEWLSPRDPGALVTVGDEARFYPLSMMTRHEIVNDAFGDVPVAVTYCPLCNTALAFDRRVDGETLRFGVSGLLRNSDLVMWDNATTSLWQQITGEGVVGHYAGTNLEIIPTAIVSFEQFAELHPEGRSLAAESGVGRRQYGINPYVGYSSSPQPFLFGGEIDTRLPALSRVIGVDAGEDGARAYPFAVAQAEGVINDSIGNTPIVVFAAGETADALDQRSIGESNAIGTALALSPVVDGETLTFAAATSSPDAELFIDDQTGSTWTLLGLAVDGPLAGSQLDTVIHRNEFWFAWQAFFGADTVYEP